MKRISIATWMLLLISGLLFGQAKFFLPIPVTGSNNRGLNNQTVVLKNTGTSTTVATLTYLSGSAGAYYWTGGTSTVPWGDYDVYVAGKLWRENVSIRNGYTIETVARDTVAQVLADSLDDYLPRYLQYKDTVQLKLASPDSAGMFVYLSGLSSANGLGEGILVSTPAANYSTNSITVFSSGNGSYEWVRTEHIQGLDWNAEWAGMIGDDSNDNLQEFNFMYPKVVAANTNIYFPEGIYRFSDSLRVRANTIHKRVPMIYGKGYTQTTLKWTGNTHGFKLTKGSTAAIYNPVIRDMRIEGPGVGTSTKAGIRADTTHTGHFEGIYFTGWMYDIYTDQANGLLIDRCWFNASKIGYSSQNSSNEWTALDCYSTADIDSIVFDLQTGTKGAQIIGGGFAHAPIHIRTATSAKINIVGANFEGAEDYWFYAEANSNIRTVGVQIGSPDTLGWAGNGARIELYGIEGLGAGYERTVLAQSVAVDVRNYSTSDIRILDESSNVFYFASVFESNPSTGSFAADSSNRGRIYSKWRTSGSGNQDAITFNSQTAANDYHTYNLLNGSDWRVSTTGAQPTFNVDRMRFVTGTVNGSAVGNTDSTRISVPFDTLGYQTIYYASAMADLDNTALVGAAYDWGVMVLDQNHASNTGRVEFIVHHAALTSTTAFKLRYLLIARANQSWGQD